MRAIIRLSIDREKNSALRNKLLARLKSHGFRLQPRTATYENPDIDDRGLGQALSDFWNTAELHRKHLGKPGRVDHFWMYCDRKRPPRNSN